MKTFEELMAQEQPKLLNCVHCGLCLDECPTYRLSGDENNSPRGRLALWRAQAEGRLEPDATTEFYTAECVGCMACVSACPANVPYGDLLLEARAEQVRRGRMPGWPERLAASLARKPALFQAATLPLRLARNFGLRLHRLLFPGDPALWRSSASYAAQVNAALKPQGQSVALLTGCAMEGAFRELNFATIRVLAVNGFKVEVPQDQNCCGAIHEHAGLPDKAALDVQNQAAFSKFDAVVTNSSGCGLSLRHALGPKQRDLIQLLESADLKQGAKLPYSHVYYDFPCHAYHGLGLKSAPERVFKAIGTPWSLAPDADRCCGSGGAYALTHEENSKQILKEKSAFLNGSPHLNPVLATANHVCMMQWASARTAKPFQVKHLVQLLDESYRAAGYYSAIPN